MNNIDDEIEQSKTSIRQRFENDILKIIDIAHDSVNTSCSKYFNIKIEYKGDIYVLKHNTAYYYSTLCTKKGRRIRNLGPYTNRERLLEALEIERTRIQKKKILKENPDTLDVIKRMLKDAGYNVSRCTGRNYRDNEWSYLRVGPTILPFFIHIKGDNIVYRLYHHEAQDHIMPTDLANPNSKTLDNLMTIVKYVSTDFDALEKKFGISKGE